MLPRKVEKWLGNGSEKQRTALSLIIVSPRETRSLRAKIVSTGET